MAANRCGSSRGIWTFSSSDVSSSKKKKRTVHAYVFVFSLACQSFCRVIENNIQLCSQAVYHSIWLTKWSLCAKLAPSRQVLFIVLISLMDASAEMELCLRVLWHESSRCQPWIKRKTKRTYKQITASKRQESNMNNSSRTGPRINGGLSATVSWSSVWIILHEYIQLLFLHHTYPPSNVDEESGGNERWESPGEKRKEEIREGEMDGKIDPQRESVTKVIKSKGAWDDERDTDCEKEREAGKEGGAIEKSVRRERGGEATPRRGKSWREWWRDDRGERASGREGEREQSVRAPIHLEFH